MAVALLPGYFYPLFSHLTDDMASSLLLYLLRLLHFAYSASTLGRNNIDNSKKY